MSVKRACAKRWYFRADSTAGTVVTHIGQFPDDDGRWLWQYLPEPSAPPVRTDTVPWDKYAPPRGEP